MPQTKTVDLDKGEVSFREPTAGELRGIQLVPLAQGDTDQLVKLLPRISEMTGDEAQGLSFSDLLICLGAIMAFLPAGARAPSPTE